MGGEYKPTKKESMEHTHSRVVICDHISERPDVIWVEAGKVQMAVCGKCAQKISAEDPEVESCLKPLCISCARVQGLPTTARMSDGFYEWRGSGWIKESDGLN